MKKKLYSLAVLLILTKYIAFSVEGFIGVYILMFGIGVLVVLSVLLLYYLFKLIISRNSIWKSYLPLVIGLLSIFIVTYSPIEKTIEYFRSPIVLSGYCEHTVTSVYLGLRGNGTFEHDPGYFLSSKTSSGTYIIKNDTIILKFINGLDNIGTNDTLILSKDYFTELGNDSIHLHTFRITINHLHK